MNNFNVRIDFKRSSVPRIGKHDNILCAIQKNEPDELGKQGRSSLLHDKMSKDEVTRTNTY